MSNISKEQWRSFSQHLDQALQMPVSQRVAWLKSLATTEPGIAAEIQRKLAARDHAAFDRFLAGSALAGAVGGGPEFGGRQLGPYLIDWQIGSRGAGSVWRGHLAERHSQPVSVVAIKFLQALGLNKASIDRLRGRQWLLDQLQHPNIARLIDCGVFDDAQPYLVMEHVEGEPIDEYCDRLKLDAQARLALFEVVLGAVDHAHRHHIIHRNLKPTNIQVTSAGVVKLLGFGVARLLREDTAAAATQNYALALRPQYAAPEQLSGHAVTSATDIYALGLVLYLLLTGAPAIAAQGRSTAEVLRAAMKERSRLPSDGTGVLSERQRTLKGDLDNILARALMKDPSQRYASVNAFADDIRRHLSHRPIAAIPHSVGYRLSKFLRRLVAACSPQR